MIGSDKAMQSLGVTDAAQRAFQPTMDAAQSDLDDLRAGRLPRQAMRTIGQVAAAYNAPGGVFVPRVPKYASMWLETTPKAMREQYYGALNQAEKILGDRLPMVADDLILPTGEFTAMSKTALSDPRLGKFGDMVRLLEELQSLQGGRKGD